MRWLFIVAAFLLTAPAHAASFDCAKASTDMEKAICTNPVLSEWDERIATAYKAFPKLSRYYDAYRQNQRNWLSDERSADETSFEYRYHLLTMANTVMGCLEGGNDFGQCQDEGHTVLDTCMSAGNYTTLAMNMCSGQLASVFDIILDVEGDRLAAQFNEDPATQELFRESETAFEAFREADCGWQFSEYRDGTIRGQIYLGCYLFLSEQRARALLSDLSGR